MSRRQARLTTGASEALNRHRKRWLWRDHGLASATETGKPLDRHNVCKRSFTLATYSHVLPGMGDAAGDGRSPRLKPGCNKRVPATNQMPPNSFRHFARF